MLEIKHLSYQVEDEAGQELGILNDHVTLRLDSEQQAYFGALDSGTDFSGQGVSE